jgi:hypothetical protein
MTKFDPAKAPKLDIINWPKERLRKAERSYAIEYVRSLLPTMQELLGPEEAAALVGRTARLIGLQFYEETAAIVGAASFARYLAAMQAAQGEALELLDAGDMSVIVQKDWRLMQGVALSDPESAFRSWNALWEGALAAHNRHLTLQTERSGDAITWRLA